MQGVAFSEGEAGVRFLPSQGMGEAVCGLARSRLWCTERLALQFQQQRCYFSVPLPECLYYRLGKNRTEGRRRLQKSPGCSGELCQACRDDLPEGGWQG